MINDLRITTLVENSTSDTNLSAEHGLSFWIELDGKKILFDTGQSNIVIDNAKSLGVDLSTADAIILSHGHYDHVGGLVEVLDIARDAKIYMHPAALKPKFGKKTSQAKANGMSQTAIDALEGREVIFTEKPTEILAGMTLTGQVPRKTDFEDVGGAFFVDQNCQIPDIIPDDQSLFIQTPKGIVIIFGCAHSGAVNILDYISKLSGKNQFYAALGGMHLIRASDERIEKTLQAFEKYGLQVIAPVHCTGSKAFDKFKSDFTGKCITCPVTSRLDLQEL
jgi:7,8-dihydropterin-6-yl-methyl-4-(beta-D-ribofuranosyl)aminobenzene 5'-phosphate synthase